MRRFTPLLFLVLTAWSCSDQSTPVLSEISLPFSITDELTSTQITGRILNYDTTTHPGFIGLAWHSWHGTGLERENYFLESDGTFSFTVYDNVVRDYNLQYNNQFFEFAVMPGSTPHLEIIPKGKTFTFSAPQDSLVANSNYLIEALANRDYWERGNQVFNYQTNLDSIQHGALLLEENMRQRFDSLWLEGGHTDPVLHEFVSQFIDHRTRRTLPFRVRALSKERERPENNKKFLYPEMGRELPDIPVYNMNNVNRIQNEFALLADLMGNRTMVYPKEKRKEANFKLYLSLIDSVYTGFSRDMLRASMLLSYLKLEDPPTTAQQLAAEMIQTTPYPSLREPLEKQLAILNPLAAQVDAYEQSFLDIPEGLDNPIPAILEKHAGKVIVLDFWATWCSPCIREMKNGYPQLIRKYSPDEVAFVFLARRSSPALWRDHISKLQFSADHYLSDDQQTAVVNQLFGISGVPHHTIFDQEGNLVKGKASRLLSGLEREINTLLIEE